MTYFEFSVIHYETPEQDLACSVTFECSHTEYWRAKALYEAFVNLFPDKYGDIIELRHRVAKTHRFLANWKLTKGKWKLV